MGLMLGAIQATLSIDNGGFKRGLLEAQAVTSTFGETFSAFVANPVLGAIQTFTMLGRAAVAGLGVASKAAANLAAEMENIVNVSKRTGLSTDLIQALGLVLKNAGYDAGIFTAAIDAMTRKLGDANTDGGRTVQQLAKVGLTIERLNSVSKDRAFLTLVEAIQSIEDPMLRAAYAADFFDRSVGLKLITAAEGGAAALQRMIEEGKRAGNILGKEVVEAGLRTDDAIDTVTNAVDGLFQKLTGDALVGFAAGLGNAGTGAKTAAELIANDLGPAVQKLSYELGRMVNNLDMILTKSREIQQFTGGLIMGLSGGTFGQSLRYGAYVPPANGGASGPTGAVHHTIPAARRVSR